MPEEANPPPDFNPMEADYYDPYKNAYQNRDLKQQPGFLNQKKLAMIY